MKNPISFHRSHRHLRRKCHFGTTYWLPSRICTYANKTIVYSSVVKRKVCRILLVIAPITHEMEAWEYLSYLPHPHEGPTMSL